MERKTFILYTDLGTKIRKLTREEKGALLEAILAFENEEDLPEDLPAGAEIAFDFLLPQLQENKENYSQVSEGRKRAANARWGDAKNANASFAYAKNANASDAYAQNANAEDTDTDTDKEKDTAIAVSKEKAPEKDQKHHHGKHVLLTDAEFDRLGRDYGEEARDEAIAYLDNHIEMKGYKANSHNLALRKWVFDAVKEDKLRKQKLARDEQNLQKAPPGRRRPGISEEKAGIQNRTDFDSAALAQLFDGL